jgi:hypothetical protein
VMTVATDGIAKEGNNSPRARAVKKRLVELFNHCRRGDYRSAASYLVYRGDDTARKWKDVYNYDHPEDREYVDGFCKNMKLLLEVIDNRYTFTKFHVEKESEGEWLVWQMRFRFDGKQKTNTLACLKIKGEYCLGDGD